MTPEALETSRKLVELMEQNDKAAAEAAYQDETGEVDEKWAVRTLEDANWCLKRIGELEREIAENEAIAAREAQRLRDRTAKLNERAQKGVAFFTAQVALYARDHRTELLGSGRKKTRALPHGSIAWRTRGGGLEVLDKGALLDWARLQPAELGLVRITEAPALDEVKKAFKASGELPPGCDVKPETEEIIVKAELGEASHGEH